MPIYNKMMNTLDLFIILLHLKNKKSVKTENNLLLTSEKNLPICDLFLSFFAKRQAFMPLLKRTWIDYTSFYGILELFNHHFSVELLQCLLKRLKWILNEKQSLYFYTC
jgi:hypothetical protein